MRMMLATAATRDFVDPTIPGLSGQDLVKRASSAISTGCPAASGACWRREHAFKRGLADLDANRLRDLGIDRSAS